MKQVPSNIRDPVSDQFNRPEFYRNQFHRYKGVAGEKPVVGKVLLSANDDSFLVVKTLVRHVRYAWIPATMLSAVIHHVFASVTVAGTQ